MPRLTTEQSLPTLPLFVEISQSLASFQVDELISGRSFEMIAWKQTLLALINVSSKNCEYKPAIATSRPARAFSSTAKLKIEAKGGKCEVIALKSKVTKVAEAKK